MAEEERDKFEEWRKAARRAARELNERLNVEELRERVETKARAAQDAIKEGASRVLSEAERARVEAERLAEQYGVGEQVRRTTETASKAAQEATQFAKDAAKDATRAAREATREAQEIAGEAARGASETFRQAGRRASENFSDAYTEARAYYERAARFYEQSARLSRIASAATVGAAKTYNWARRNPKQFVTVSLSIAAGVRLGAAFPSLDGVLLGAHPHWFTHSALPMWALRRAGAKFDEYLRERETLVKEGRLTEAEQRRIEFESKIARYVGAPLLGAFSCAAGVAIMAQIFQPGAITGAPISWLLGGNPFLDGIWLFANGVICFQQGYKFFMIALKDQAEAQKIVRELRGLLPAAGEA
jgi:hypothetical protein